MEPKEQKQPQVIDVLGTTFEEDIETAFNVCVTHFGPVGRIIYPVTKKTFPNVLVSTKKHGKLWYGDLQESDLKKLSSIQDEIGDVVEVS
jgi:hypothetical protein